MAKKVVVEDKQAKEQALQQQLMMYQLLQQQLEELKKQAVALQTRFQEIEATSQALDDITKAKKGSEILIPLGGGLFVNGTLAQGDLLVSVGAEVMTRKTPAEAGVLIEKKKKEIEGLSEGLQQEMLAIVGKISELGTSLEQAMAEARK